MLPQVRADTNFMELLDADPWLKDTKLVVKPDMLFGKRGKHDLVGLNLDFAGVEAFIKARMGKVVDMDGCVGAINTFVVEPFVPHKQEYYLCIQVIWKRHKLASLAVRLAPVMSGPVCWVMDTPAIQLFGADFEEHDACSPAVTCTIVVFPVAADRPLYPPVCAVQQVGV
jgi:hypothetical protein